MAPGRQTAKQSRIIETTRQLEDGLAALVAICPHMARAHAVAGTPPLRRWSPGFDGIVRIVVGQQLSIASATAIHGRLAQAISPLDASGIQAAADAVLLAAGLSKAKVATVRALAAAVGDGCLPIADLSDLDDAGVHAALTSVRGIGPWTADIYLLFGLGRADAFAAGDLALQVATARLMDLPDRPKADALLDIAERWRPWRGIAARLLWAYYAVDRPSARM